MTGVLLLAYHFPPLGGPGTQRSVKLVRHLPAFGYRPSVVTGPGVSQDRWDVADPTMLDEVPDDVAVIRVPGPLPRQAPGRLARWLDRPGAFAPWWVEGAVAAGRPLAEAADVLYATMAPYETAFAAARLAEETGKPWVADLRDPWALDEMRVYPSAIHHRRDLARMGAALRSAHAIVMNTPEAARALTAALPELGLKHVACVPNGYDEEDLQVEPAAAPPERFRIAHTGSLHTDLGLRHQSSGTLRLLFGGSAPVDILTRSHVHLMAALELLAREQPAITDAVEVHFAGEATAADRAVGRSQTVRFHGYLDHRDSVALLRSADLLFLPMHDLPTGHRARIVPGKTYEYLASGRPILAAVPEGDARDLLAQVPGAHVVRPNDVLGMAAAIAREVRAKRRDGRRPDAVPAVAARFERRRIASEIAEVLDRVGPGPSRRPPYPERRLRLVGCAR